MTHVAVVGAYGSAGAAAASRLADAPEVEELTLFDDGDPGGGLCILRGCMPSKEVLSVAEHRYAARHDDRLVGELPDVDLEATVAWKDEHTGSFAEHRRGAIAELAEREDVTFRRERARFADHPDNADPGAARRVLDVGEREEQLAVDAVVVATGSTVNVPTLPGLEAAGYWTSDEVLDATDFPDSGIVMGLGYVGVELVPYLAEAAGMELTVIEHDARPLDRAAPELGDAVLECYREEFGVEIRTHAHEQSVETTADGQVRLHLEERPPGGEPTLDSVTADALFAFTGRVPALDVGLEHTRIDPREGWVEATMQCADDPRVFAAGDVTGDRMLLHNAKEEGFTAATNVRRLVASGASEPEAGAAADGGAATADTEGTPGGPSLEPYEPIHHSVMFAGAGRYPYASVGMTAEEARTAGHDPIVATRDAADDGIFRVKDVPRGAARLVVARDGTVLGYHGVHHHADVMAKTLQIVVECGLTVQEIPDRAFHPTTPELLDGLLRDAAEEL